MRIRIAALVALALMAAAGATFAVTQGVAAQSGFRTVEFTFYADKNGDHVKNANESYSSNRTSPTERDFRFAIYLENPSTGWTHTVYQTLAKNDGDHRVHISLSNDLEVIGVWEDYGNTWLCNNFDFSPSPGNDWKDIDLVLYERSSTSYDVLVTCGKPAPITGE
jgi:hypothetical protein